jgi:hypothetical protein
MRLAEARHSGKGTRPKALVIGRWSVRSVRFAVRTLCPVNHGDLDYAEREEGRFAEYVCLERPILAATPIHLGCVTEYVPKPSADGQSSTNLPRVRKQKLAYQNITAVRAYDRRATDRLVADLKAALQRSGYASHRQADSGAWSEMSGHESFGEDHQLPKEGAAMAVREFTNSKGITWRVWSTRPSSPRLYSQELRSGWLTFESEGQRRRLAPIPNGWDEVSEDRLELLCRNASVVAARSSRESEWIDRVPEPQQE